MNAPGRLALLILVVALAAGTLVVPAAAAAASPRPVRCAACWHPAPGTSLHIQYSGDIDTTVDATAYNLDGFDTSKALIRSLKAQGRTGVCYISGGTYENWRPDRRRFPKRVIGKADAGWAGEYWLDIRQRRVLKPIMKNRMRICRAKGFRAVDVDNVAGYAEQTGFPITARQQLKYNRMLADMAHRMQLSIGLKNDGPQVAKLLPWFDFAVVEQCYEYDECAPFDRFVAAGKAVFVLEYNLATTSFCADAAARGFTAQSKHLSLDAWSEQCPAATLSPEQLAGRCVV